MRFTWDRAKERRNLRKHGVAFEEATTVFGDPLAVTILDPQHSIGEERLPFVSFRHAERRRMSDRTTRHKAKEPEMRAEYDFSAGLRGKYHKRYTANSNVVVLEPDVHKRFKNSSAVNKALRRLIRSEGAKRSGAKRSRRASK